MKKLASIIAGLLIISSTYVFAEEHAAAALEHANAAVAEGKADKPAALVVHSKAALEQTLAAAIIAKGKPKHHLDEGGAELQKAIDEGNLGHTADATKHAEAAVVHITAGNK